MSTIQLNAWTANNFTTGDMTDILFLSVILLCCTIISVAGLKITPTLSFLISFLQNILCKHNAWADDNLATLDMLFLSIIAQYNKPNKSKNDTRAFVNCLLL